LEAVIADLENSRDRYVIGYLNEYPRLSVKAHTRPFERRWMNIIAAIIVPVGMFLYLRMWSFRIRLAKDLRDIHQTNGKMIERIKEKAL